MIPSWVRDIYVGDAEWVHLTAHPNLGVEKIKRAKRSAFRTRKFCQTCNTGWMFELEAKARPLLASMAGGAFSLASKPST